MSTECTAGQDMMAWASDGFSKDVSFKEARELQKGDVIEFRGRKLKCLKMGMHCATYNLNQNIIDADFSILDLEFSDVTVTLSFLPDEKVAVPK